MKTDIERIVEEYRRKVTELYARRLEREKARKARLAEIKRLQAQGMTLREIGEQLGVSKQRIHQILKGSTCE